MQPKISMGFAVAVISLVAGFFAWMIWLSGRVQYLETNIVNKSYATYMLENDANTKARVTACAQDTRLCLGNDQKEGKMIPCPVPGTDSLVVMSESACKKLLQH